MGPHLPQTDKQPQTLPAELDKFLADYLFTQLTNNSYRKRVNGTELTIILKVATHPSEGGNIYSAALELVTDRPRRYTIFQPKPIPMRLGAQNTTKKSPTWKALFLKEIRRLFEIAAYAPYCNCGPRIYRSRPDKVEWICPLWKCTSITGKDVFKADPRIIRKLLESTGLDTL